jgi:hypothetical protein
MFVDGDRRRCPNRASVDEAVSPWSLCTRNRVASSRAQRHLTGDGAREVSVSA